jgi:uncharacterized protein
MENEIIEKVKSDVKNIDFLSSHDYYHLLRVYMNAISLCANESVSESTAFIVQISALLHDVGHKKVVFDKLNDHEKDSVAIAKEILSKYQINGTDIEKIVYCILHHRFSKDIDNESIEIKILQDADRLDALGAISIARTFSYDSNRPIYIPDVSPKENYDGISLSSINHIVEKILKLTPDVFNTKSAKEIAKSRLVYVQEFVEEFMNEWNGIK